MKVLSNYVAIHEIEEDQTTESGIYLGASKNTNPIRKGVVVGVGPGIPSLTSGAVIPTDEALQVGTSVLVNITNSLPIKHENDTLHLLKTSDVVAIIE